MEWNLNKKKETIARVSYKCNDCDKTWPVGAYVKRFTFKNTEGTYSTRKICEECEKYYRRKDLEYKEIE